ncbi:hypothetical protein F3Y22_tig00110890pilonHSYRG00156 [Hibiscus syriacus]|uniref:Uncharacterized protein n=1 Tax=Hibiscus syriacus TaxID=106335 RepID=A0A6A2ZI37_HIBSY|nr:hypothetical protein F3Y22_tig00110890pilonHSYRG00156 [Hibiscus syriacus]
MDEVYSFGFPKNVHSGKIGHRPFDKVEVGSGKFRGIRHKESGRSLKYCTGVVGLPTEDNDQCTTIDLKKKPGRTDRNIVQAESIMGMSYRGKRGVSKDGLYFRSTDFYSTVGRVLYGYRAVLSVAAASHRLLLAQSPRGCGRLEDSSILRENMFLFKFKTLNDKLTIMRRTPWSFNGTLLALVHYDLTLSLEEFDFAPLAVWVSIHELPLGLMRKATAIKNGNKIGQTIAIDIRLEEGRMKDFLRVLVEINYSKTLRHFEESSRSRRESVVYLDSESREKLIASSGNSPLSDCPPRTARGREWVSGRDLLHLVSTNPEDETNSTDPDSLPSHIYLVRHSSEEEDPSKLANEQLGDVYLTMVVEVQPCQSSLMFPGSSVSTVPTTCSDHCALFLNMENIASNRTHRVDYFKFDVCWAKEEQCGNIVRSIWENNDDSLSSKLKKMGDKLGRWQRMRKGQVNKDEKRIRHRILDLVSVRISDSACEQRCRAMAELKELIDKDEVYWKQQSRSSSTEPDEEILQAIDRWVTPMENDMLGRNFTPEEVIQAFSQVNPSKASGHDVFVPKIVSPKSMKNFQPINLCSVIYKIVSKGLSTLLLEAQRRNDIKGIWASLRGLRISHLLYADDNILFVKNYVEELRKVRNILLKYEKASGQKINFEKSNIYFSHNTPLTDRLIFLNELGVVESQDPGNYLGLLLVVGKGNQLWVLIHDEESLAFKFLKAKYFPCSNFLYAKLGDKYSYAWATILKAKDALGEGFLWRVGINSTSKMFCDNWGDSGPIQLKERYMDNGVDPVKVADCMLPGCPR